jgi:mono/diheme cytochrome c family protein
MKRLVFAVVTIALLAIPLAAWAAEDGAALYKSKCVICHSADGKGKPDKYPAVAGSAMTPEKIAELLEKGVAGKKAPHAKPIAAITADQAKAIAAFVKGLPK